MKKTLLCTLLFGLTATQLHAAELTGCAAKKADIQRQIAYAEQHHNQHRVTGLNKALAEVENHCTDASLLADRKAKITEKERKVAERQAELDKATASGRSDKIAAKQKKLNEAQQELKQAQSMLLK